MLKGKRKIQGDSKPGLMELPAHPKPHEAKGLPFDHVSSNSFQRKSYGIEYAAHSSES